MCSFGISDRNRCNVFGLCWNVDVNICHVTIGKLQSFESFDEQVPVSINNIVRSVTIIWDGKLSDRCLNCD